MTYINVHSGFICNNQNQEATQKTINRWMDKQLWHIHTMEHYWTTKKEWTIERCNKMDEYQNNYAECKKADKKRVPNISFHLY